VSGSDFRLNVFRARKKARKTALQQLSFFMAPDFSEQNSKKGKNRVGQNVNHIRKQLND
jgi:hypothetical protein